MATLSLKYIENALKRGETEEQIKKFLRIQGVTQGEIDEVFNELKAKKGAPPVSAANSSSIGSVQKPVSQAPQIPQAPKSLRVQNLTGQQNQAQPVGRPAVQPPQAPTPPQPPVSPKPTDSVVYRRPQAEPAGIPKPPSQLPTQPQPVITPQSRINIQSKGNIESMVKPQARSVEPSFVGRRPEEVSAEIKPEHPEDKTVLNKMPSMAQTERLEYAKKGGSKKWIFLPLLALLLAGIGVVGYYNYDTIYDFIMNKPAVEEFTEPAPIEQATPTTPAEETTAEQPAATSSVEEELPAEGAVEEEEVAEVEEITDLNLAKVNDISEAQEALDEDFNTNGVYPNTYEIINDPDSFYCYRKEGAHYIIGTLLDEDYEALETDLDGVYKCGDTTKECADPVYCKGPLEE